MFDRRENDGLFYHIAMRHREGGGKYSFHLVQNCGKVVKGMATPPSTSDEGISQYELERNQRIAANRQLLVDLGLASAIRSAHSQVWWHRHQACTGLVPCNHAAQQMPSVHL